jgi:hypothetical protein
MCSHSQVTNLIFTMIDYFESFAMIDYFVLFRYFFLQPLRILLKWSSFDCSILIVYCSLLECIHISILLEVIFLIRLLDLHDYLWSRGLFPSFLFHLSLWTNIFYIILPFWFRSSCRVACFRIHVGNTN